MDTKFDIFLLLPTYVQFLFVFFELQYELHHQDQLCFPINAEKEHTRKFEPLSGGLNRRS